MTTVEPRATRQVEVLQTVNAHLPDWRSRTLPRWIRTAVWPTRPVVVDGHEFAVSILPAVGLTWFSRGGRYWYRLVQLMVLMLIAAAVIITFDVGFGQSALETSAATLAWLLVVLAALAAAALVLYWRPDLFAKRPVPGAPRPPDPLRVAGLAVGLLGLCLTPAWVLSFAVDLVPRFPWQERAARALLANQQPDGWGEPIAPHDRRG